MFIPNPESRGQKGPGSGSAKLFFEKKNGCFWLSYLEHIVCAYCIVNGGLTLRQWFRFGAAKSSGSGALQLHWTICVCRDQPEDHNWAGDEGEAAAQEVSHAERQGTHILPLISGYLSSIHQQKKIFFPSFFTFITFWRYIHLYPSSKIKSYKEVTKQ
jgi:hypothetical protein